MQSVIYHFNEIPEGSIWPMRLRNMSEDAKRTLKKQVRTGEWVKVRAYWYIGSIPKTVYVKVTP